MMYATTRSGFYNTQSTGKRKTKSQGMSQLNTYCIAFIKATKYRETGKIQVQTCTTHYGHLQQVEHIRLPEKVKLSIADQMSRSFIYTHIGHYQTW